MPDTKKYTLVIGASENPERYSNKAVRALLRHGHAVYAIGLRTGSINGVPIQKGQPALKDVDTITVYLSAKNQEAVMDYLLSLFPRRIIFNPGAENPVLEKRALEKGIVVEEACTLVLLSTGQF
ncbi:MAG: CoA-binding protein [Bacteroidetes bacterium]|nr:CoA-binding protein [Bacteroidota bacterium]